MGWAHQPSRWNDVDAELLFIYGKEKNILFYPGTTFLTEEVILASWVKIINIISFLPSWQSRARKWYLVLIVLFPWGSISQTPETSKLGLHMSDCTRVLSPGVKVNQVSSFSRLWTSHPKCAEPTRGNTWVQGKLLVIGEYLVYTKIVFKNLQKSWFSNTERYFLHLCARQERLFFALIAQFVNTV